MSGLCDLLLAEVMEILSPKSDCGTEVSCEETLIQFFCSCSEVLKKAGRCSTSPPLWGNLWYSSSLSNCATNKVWGG